MVGAIPASAAIGARPTPPDMAASVPPFFAGTVASASPLVDNYLDRDMSNVEPEKDRTRAISTSPPSTMERAGSSGVVESVRSGALSSAPTHVPTFDVNAIAEAAFHCQKAPMPFDMAVPTRREDVKVEKLELRAAFLLLHVDGRSSIAEIAAMTEIPLAEATKHMRELVALGVVTVASIDTR